jgi:CHAT domain-containing protein
MKLSIAALGDDNLACTVARGTLRHKHLVAYAPDRVSELASETVSILHRGNRTHKLTESNLEQLRVVGEELARRLLPQPVLGDVRRTMGTLTLELDEELLSFPWELLYDGEQFLCRRFDMGRIVRTGRRVRAVVQRNQPSPPLRLLIICSDPEGDLPQVEREGLEIVSQIDQSPTLLARMVTEADLKFARRELKDHDLVHFAGHAEPISAGRSGWKLQDGLLETSEIADMGAGRPMPALVFSNACQSGVFHSVGSGQQAFGLAQAFLTAGVRHYVGTQWDMVDGQGAQFARHLYADLARGASVGAAVRNARNRVIAESGEGQLAWASYVLYGDPDSVLLPVTESPEVGAPEPPPLRLGVRATAPFKPRGRSVTASTSTGPVAPVSEPVASGPPLEEAAPRQKPPPLLIAMTVVALLSLLVSSSLVVLFVSKLWTTTGTDGESGRGDRSSTSSPAPAASANGGALVGRKGGPAHEDAQNGVVIHIVRPGEPPGARVRDGLAVLEACLLDGLSRRTGISVMQQPSGGSEPENEPTHLLSLTGHTLAGEVVMTAKVVTAKRSDLVSSSVIRGDKKMLESCRALGEKITEDLRAVSGRSPRSPRPGRSARTSRSAHRSARSSRSARVASPRPRREARNGRSPARAGSS